MGVAEVVGSEGLWEPRSDERRENDVVAEHRNLEASEALHGPEQGSGRRPIVRVQAGEHHSEVVAQPFGHREHPGSGSR